MHGKFGFASKRYSAAMVVASAVLLAGFGATSIAKTVYDRSGLATCVPDAEESCADMVTPDGSIKPLPNASTGRTRIDQSPSSDPGLSAGAAPQVLTAPDLRLGKPQATPQATSYVNTKIIEKNNTPYSVYWRVAAIRNGQGWAWPSGSTYYTAKKYSTVTKVIKCIKGETLYFGATSTNQKYYWGYSADFNHACTSGCSSYCSGGTITVTLNY